VRRRLATLGVVVAVLAVGTFLGSALTQLWAPGDVAVGVLPVSLRRERVRVEVLNGGGVVGMARSATDLLRDNGFDVVFYGNGPEESTSVVLDRSGRLDMARSVADALGIKNVRSEPDSNLYLDATVRLGGEWSRDAAPIPRGSEPPAWWNPRGWFGADAIQQGPIADPGGA
jgi:hypothetical protein